MSVDGPVCWDKSFLTPVTFGKLLKDSGSGEIFSSESELKFCDSRTFCCL